ncbi:MAG TPA: hypothetical protein PLC52_10435 [Anaerolineales bacterium]|nr:hypothetical protein [Anaerolineales bacterium]HRQ93265.1 hypothetical protein [Anaerolineales bacterium]
MKNVNFKVLLAIGVLAIAALACGFSANTANFEQAYMSADAAGTAPTSVYGANDVFYAIVDLANASDSTEVRAVWTAINVAGESPNTLIDEVSIESGDALLTFDLANTGMLWPTGTYKVDLYLNGELETTLNFQVQ